MIRRRTTIEHATCESCGGPSDNPDVSEIVTFGIGVHREALSVIRLCDHCIETELLPAVAPWAVSDA